MQWSWAGCAVGFILVCFTAGCAGGDAGTNDMITGMNEAVDALKGINDRYSARSAKPKLKSAAERYVAGTERAKELSAEQRKRLDESARQAKSEIERVQRIPGGNEALAVFVAPVTEANRKLANKTIPMPQENSP